MLSQLQDPSSPLAAVLQRSDIWTGDRLAGSCQTLPSGHPALDAELPGGGWPRGALVDLLHPRSGIGELALVLPALAALTAQDEWVVVQAAPQRIFAPAWQAAGVKLARLIVVEAVPGNPRLAGSDTLWAAEQILRAGSVSAALLWLPRGSSSAQLRRLQVAAEAGGTLAFLFQDESSRDIASPAPLRLRLEVQPAGLAVHLFKRRGAPLARPILLPLADRLSTPARRRRDMPFPRPAELGEVIQDNRPGQGSIGQNAIDQGIDSQNSRGAKLTVQDFAEPGLAPRPGEADLFHALARPDFPQAAA